MPRAEGQQAQGCEAVGDTGESRQLPGPSLGWGPSKDHTSIGGAQPRGPRFTLGTRGGRGYS